MYPIDGDLTMHMYGNFEGFALQNALFVLAIQ